MAVATHAQRAQSDAPPTSSKTISSNLALFAEAVTINRPRPELFTFWSDPTNLVHIMENIIAIERIDATRSSWTVKAPGGAIGGPGGLPEIPR